MIGVFIYSSWGLFDGYKSVRLEKRLRVEEVEDQVDITGSYYTIIEAGSRNPSVKVAKRLGVLFGVEWSSFFEGEKVAVG